MLTIVTWDEDVDRFSINQPILDAVATPNAVVIYRPEINVHPDRFLFDAQLLVERSKVVPVTVYTLDAVFFTALRVALMMAEEEAKLVFYARNGYEEPMEIRVDRNGRMDDWPTFTLYADLLGKLLRGQMDRRHARG